MNSRERGERAVKRLEDIVLTVEGGYPYYGVPQTIKYAIKALKALLHDLPEDL